MTDGAYKKEYWGNVVIDDSNSHHYFMANGSMVHWVPKEIVNLLVQGEHITNEVVKVEDIADIKPSTGDYIDNGIVSLLDIVGAKPKSLNIEF